MEKFNFLFGIVLGEMILGQTDNLSKAFQAKTLTAAEGQKLAKLTVATLQSIRNDEMYDLFWLKCTKLAEKLHLEEPTLPRAHERPKRFDDGLAQSHVYVYPYHLNEP